MTWQQQLGEDIAKARRKVDMTQDELHKAVGVSRNTLVKYEKGRIPPPFETLAKIAAATRADEFIVEELHVTFSHNGARPAAVPQQLKLDFDKDGGVTVRIEPDATGLVIRAVSA